MAINNRVLIARRRGGPAVLEVLEEPAPRPGPLEALVEIEAAGVAFADVLIREGLYPGIGPYPRRIGYDCVGHIAALGSDVEGWAVGDRVAALTVTGAAARLLAWPARDLTRVPTELDAAEAVALVLNYVTAEQMLSRIAGLGPGRTALVHGGGGGVGAALLELARLEEVRCWATASAGKHALVSRLGGRPIDYRTEDFVARLAHEAPSGVDAVFDPIGGAHWKRSFQTLGPGGVLVAYGFQAAAPGGRMAALSAATAAVQQPRYAPLDLLSASRVVAGYNITIRKQGRPEEFRFDLARLFNRLARAELHPVIAGRIPLSQAREAHAKMGSGQVAGKLVIIPD